jgi:hypothetical protein
MTTMPTKNIHTNPPGNRADWIAAAINYLNADQHERGWVYRDHTTKRRYIAIERDLVILGKMLARREPDAYSYWATWTGGVEFNEDEIR